MYRPLRWVWGVLIGGLVLWPLIGICARGWILGTGCTLWKPASTFVDTHYPWLVLFLFVLGGLTWFARQDYRRRQLRQNFDLLKPVGDLLPEDLGFQVVKPGEEAELGEQSDLYRRPFYEAVYVPRLAVPYDHRANENSVPHYNENDLADSLRENKDFVLIGSPADGKTRTLYEILDRMDGYELLRPKLVNERLPKRADLSLVLRGKRVVLLLDGLEDYVGCKADLLELGRSLDACKIPWVVASTSQDEPELTKVKQDLGSFYDGLHLRTLWLIPPTLQQKRQLAEDIGEDDWDPDKILEYPTLGSIVMKGALATMKRRFDILLHDHPEQANILRALKLLVHAGVQPYTENRLRAVLGCEHLFPRSDYHLQQNLESLASQSFLRFGTLDKFQPERAYLRYVVNYSPVKRPEEDFSDLADVLESIADTDGLFSLGTTYARDLEAYEEARRCFDRAVNLRPGNAHVWFGKAQSLLEVGGYLLGRETSKEASTDIFKEALCAYEKAVGLEPNFPEAWYGKGKVYDILQRHQEALDALDKAAELKGDFHDAWCDKGMTLVLLDRYQEALDALDEAILTDSSCPGGWRHKGDALLNLGRLQVRSNRFQNPKEPYREASAESFEEASEIFDKAVEAFDMAIDLDPDSSLTWAMKSEALLRSGRDWKAEEAIDKAISLGLPDNPNVWNDVGASLRHLRRFQDGLDAHERAIDLDPERPDSWIAKGLALYDLRRPWEEMAEAFDKAVDVRPDDPEVWFVLYNRAATLGNIGRPLESIATYEEVINLKPDFAEAWFNKGLALEDLERLPQALEAFEKAKSLGPNDPRPWEKMGAMLQKLGRYQEAKEAFGKAASVRQHER